MPHTRVADSPLNPVAEPVSRADLIQDELRRAILAGDLPPGTALVERDLAARLGVSKTPIREALKVLANRGLVTLSTFKGAQVREIDASFSESIYDMRLLLEPAAVSRSVPRQSEASLGQARAALAVARSAAETGDFAGLAAQNRAFHRLLYARSGNPVLTDVLDDIQDQVALITVHGWRRRETWHVEAAEHEAILAAVTAGDADGAADALRRHIGRSLDELVRTFGADGDGT